jgi:uncharacterized lipoprotein YmbA
MKASIRTGAAALALAALSLGGCVGSPAPRIEYYTLASPDPGIAPPSSASPSVFVGPISVPAAVDRTQMVLSTGPNAVQISDDHRWAEPLRDGIARVVAETLTRDLGSSRVLASRIASGTPVDYRVAIEVQRFDSSLDGGATVDALWTITTTRGGPARNGRTRAHEMVHSRSPAALAAAHGRALQRVAGDIAAAIREMRSEKRAGG